MNTNTLFYNNTNNNKRSNSCSSSSIKSSRISLNLKQTICVPHFFICTYNIYIYFFNYNCSIFCCKFFSPLSFLFHFISFHFVSFFLFYSILYSIHSFIRFLKYIRLEIANYKSNYLFLYT